MPGYYDDGFYTRPLLTKPPGKPEKRYTKAGTGRAEEDGYTVLAKRDPYGLMGDIEPLETLRKREDMMAGYGPSDD